MTVNDVVAFSVDLGMRAICSYRLALPAFGRTQSSKAVQSLYSLDDRRPSAARFLVYAQGRWSMVSVCIVFENM